MSATPAAHTARPRARRGATLAGTLVALALGGLAAALAARTTVAVLAVHARTDAAARARHDLADALDAVEHRLRTARPLAGDLLEAHDGALALHATAGTTVLCARSGDTLLLAGAHGAHPWAAHWSRDPVAGDRLRIAVGPDSTRAAATIADARRIDLPCAPTHRSWALRAAWHVVVRDSLPPLPLGTPLDHLVRERIAAHVGADGRPALGLAAWDHAGTRWSAPQPLVAPLASASLHVAALDAAGGTLPAARLRDARLVRFVARHAAAPAADTLLVDVLAP